MPNDWIAPDGKADLEFASLPDRVQEGVRAVLAGPSDPPEVSPAEMAAQLGLDAYPEAFTPAGPLGDSREFTTAVRGGGPPQPDTRQSSSNLEEWELLGDYLIEDATFACRLTVFKGYTWDLATIPQPLRSVVSPHQLTVAVTLVHDVLYECQGNLARGLP